MGPEGLGPLSEARIYLALSRLGNPTAADVVALDSTLIQVHCCSLNLSLHFSTVRAIQVHAFDTASFSEEEGGN